MAVLEEGCFSMLNRETEIHDSVLDSMSMEENQAVLMFSHVYIHQSEGKPGVDPGIGWTQAAIIRVANAVIGSSLSEWPRDLSDGYLKVNGEVSDNMIPIPLDQGGNVELRLETWNEVVLVSGTHIRLELLGEAQYVERFPGATTT
jgi:hypothetical protein